MTALPSLDAPISAHIRQIGVIGAGQMGNGIAQVFAQRGYEVALLDISDERLASGMGAIGKNLGRLEAKGKISAADKAESLSRIRTGTNYTMLGQCDLVIEAASENETVKRAIFAQLCPVLKPEAIIASNTSSLSITRLAASTDRPARFVGMHFMNPVPVMQLVELIRGIATAEDTFA
ncbi:MAG: 3-hydroxyacyl-CoA dehydrogenase NAD-binding domain-containing protein, partial [Rhodospirillales bacterium]